MNQQARFSFIVKHASTIAVCVGMLLATHGFARAENSSAAKSMKLNIPYQATTIGQLPLWMAIDGGLFRRYGIDATAEFAGQSPAIVASLLAGETPFANLGQQAVVSADLNGGDIAILVSGPQKLFFGLYGVPKIHRLADLKGRKIGISHFGTTTDFIARYILSQAGLEPEKDVTILPVGSQIERLAAMQKGLIDAAVLGPPIRFKAHKLGYLKLADLLDDKLLFYTDALVGKRSWIAAHRAATLNVVRGFIAGIAAVRMHRKLAIATLSNHTKITDPDLLNGAYDLLVRALPRIPVPKPEAIVTSLRSKSTAAAKTANPANFIDSSFVNELERDGFIARLYKSRE